MKLLSKIASKNYNTAKTVSAAPPSQETVVRYTAAHAEPLGVQHGTSPTLADLNLPPPLPCLLCGCPGVWSTIYEPDAYRCCDCEPPPGGWHVKTGGRQFVARRLMLVIWNGVWQWEDF